MHILKPIGLLLFSACCLQSVAQKSGRSWKGHFYNAENGIHLYLDPDSASIRVPGLDFLGNMNGYMAGKIYGTWLLVSYKNKGSEMSLRFSNDQGADSQTIECKWLTDSTFSYKAIDGNNIRKAVGRKLVKVPAEMEFVRR